MEGLLTSLEFLEEGNHCGEGGLCSLWFLEGLIGWNGGFDDLVDDSGGIDGWKRMYLRSVEKLEGGLAEGANRGDVEVQKVVSTLRVCTE